MTLPPSSCRRLSRGTSSASLNQDVMLTSASSKVFGPGDMRKSLRENGLTPSAVSPFAPG